MEEQTKRLQKDMKERSDPYLAMSKSALDYDFLNMCQHTAMKLTGPFNWNKVFEIQEQVVLSFEMHLVSGDMTKQLNQPGHLMS
ncbi:hypothetical protein J0S82_011789, partial [Galemys pyrenaicus]